MLKPNLNELIVCRGLLKNTIFHELAQLLEDTQNIALERQLAADLLEAAEQNGLAGNLFFSYTTYLLTLGDNAAAKMVEKSGAIGASLRNALRNDAEILCRLVRFQPGELWPSLKLFDDYQPTFFNDNATYLNLLPRLHAAETADAFAQALVEHYRVFGYGDIANYRAFHWSEDGDLVGISHFDPIRLDDLIGYQDQKQQLAANTEAFLADRPANNVLLAGARGTGKSSAVKALANEYFQKGMRLLQITKPQLIHLPKIMQKLRMLRSKKFIIFLDDLSFEDFELEYKYLKSAIEGGVESKPDNVLIYATSNRRHLIKETWQERAAAFTEEVHRSDSINEKISLSDRFGLMIYYMEPNQREYLAIVDALLRRRHIVLDKEELRKQAVAWELSHSGRSGRIAQQFVAHYLGSCR